MNRARRLGGRWAEGGGATGPLFGRLAASTAWREDTRLVVTWDEAGRWWRRAECLLWRPRRRPHPSHHPGLPAGGDVVQPDPASCILGQGRSAQRRR